MSIKDRIADWDLIVVLWVALAVVNIVDIGFSLGSGDWSEAVTRGALAAAYLYIASLIREQRRLRDDLAAEREFRRLLTGDVNAGWRSRR